MKLKLIDKLIENSNIKMIKEKDGKTLLMKKTAIYPENYVEIENKMNVFYINVIQRDECKLVSKTENEINAKIKAIVMAKKLFDSISDEDTIGTLEELIDNGNKDCISEFFETLGFANYCIGNENTEKISMIQDEGKYNIKYRERYIVKNVKEKRAYIVLYNYSNKLKHITDFCKELRDTQFKEDLNFEELIDIYMF